MSDNYSQFNDEEKIALTLAVVFAILIICAALSLCWWRINSHLMRRKQYRRDRFKQTMARSSEDIEKDLRELEFNADTIISHTKQPETNLPKQINFHSHSAKTFSTALIAENTQSPLKVTRVVSTHQTQISDKLLTDNHSTTSSGQSQVIISPKQLAPLIDTQIGPTSSPISYRNHNPVTSNLLWPDVCDPYHRNKQLDQRLNGTLISVNQS